MLSFIGLARCVSRISKAVRAGKLFIWSGAALVTSARVRRIRVGDSDSVRTKSAEDVVSPVVGQSGYLGKLELDKWTLPHAVEILATTVR